jgi:hypothetical protein
LKPVSSGELPEEKKLVIRDDDDNNNRPDIIIKTRHKICVFIDVLIPSNRNVIQRRL